MKAPTLDVDQAGLPMLPYARSRLLQLEHRRASIGAPFLHDRVFADGTTTIDITASAVSPKIHIRTGGGAYAVAQFDGTGSDGLYYTTIKAFSQQGAVVWAVDFPGSTSRYKYRLLGISSDGARACYLESAANSIEFKTIERGVVTVGAGPLDLTSLTQVLSGSLTRGEQAISVSLANKWQTSEDATRAMFGIGYSIAHARVMAVFAGVDVTPGYVVMATTPQLVDTSNSVVLGGDSQLSIGYASVCGPDSLLSSLSDVKVYRVVVSGAEAPFSVTQDELVIDSYSAALPSLATFGSLAVSSSGKLAVGYGKMWGFPWSSTDWYSETATAKAALVVDGVEVHTASSLTPEELGPSGSGNGPVTSPIAVSDDGACVFTDRVVALAGVSTTQHWLKDSDFTFPALVYAAGMSRDGSAAFVYDARSGYSPAIYTPSGAFAVNNAFLGNRTPTFMGADSEGAAATAYGFQSGGVVTPDGVTYNSVRWTMRYDEASGAPLGYDAPTYVPPGLPVSYTRTIDKPDPTPDIDVTMALQAATADSRLRYAVV